MKYFLVTLWLFVSSLVAVADKVKSYQVAPNNLVQLIINHSSLDQYWHPKQKNRVPLNILHNRIESAEGITKFGKKIKLIKKPGKTPYLSIEYFMIKDRKWVVKIKYPVEGITATFTGKLLANDEWLLLTARVVEN